MNRGTDIRNVRLGEGVEALSSFIEGKRNQRTNWCDWDIPLHWGGMSDPFQPIERIQKRSLKCLELFAKTKYPFVVSTKNALIAEEPYFSLIKQCNCVVQFSALSSRYDEQEKGASTFEQRMDAVRKISKYKRVVIRCQPYVIELKNDIIKNIPLFKECGAYGVIFESMKAQKAVNGMIKLGVDIVYPVDVLYKHFSEFKKVCHNNGLKFYSGENRLRCMGDSLCCCGIDGLDGFVSNKANINHYLYDRDNYRFTKAMEQGNTSTVFGSTYQNSVFDALTKVESFKNVMNRLSQTKNVIKCLIPKDIK